MNKITPFNPTKAEIQTAVKKVEKLTIKGITDEAGYATVKTAKKTLAGYRISITKFGQEQRREAIQWQKEVLRQEKELLGIIEPIETNFKEALNKVDQAKKKQERKILLPARKKMLEEIKLPTSDNEILGMDEQQFSDFYTEAKATYDENERQKEIAKRLKARHKAELEKAKKRAEQIARKEEKERAKREKAEMEQERKEELARAKREKAEAIAELKQQQKEEEARKKQAELDRIEIEKKRKAELESDKRFKEFLAKNNYDDKKDLLQRDESEIRLYRFINTFKIK